MTSGSPTAPGSVSRGRRRAPYRYLRRGLFRRLARIDRGRLVVAEGAERFEFGGAAAAEPAVHLTVHDPRLYRDVALRGSIGAAEAYARGDWEADDLTGLVRIFALNPQLNEPFDRRFGFLARPLLRLLGHFADNSRRQSRRNIARHYDLGNEFFSRFLDETMMYSCAVFAPGDDDLASASTRKNELICRKLDLRPDDDVLEIGTGWGGFAVHAATHHGCRVVTTTISNEQYAFARRRVLEAGLGDRITVLRSDYRDLPRQFGRPFDKIVSIEMIEAVGHRWLPVFFGTCAKLLGPAGMMLIQAIVIRDASYERYRRSTDFIRRYIFPGGCLPSLAEMSRCVAEQTEMHLTDLQDLSPHYARTLACWRRRFTDNLPSIRALGYGEEFLRLWEYYFSYCEGGFLERSIGSVQLLLANPLNRRPPLPAGV